MSEQTFKSPNFYEREIDLSAPRITGPLGVPAGVIGTANKGPAFVPVTVANYSEFVTVFGDLDTAKFGPYAVKEFLKNRTSLTYLRVLGAGANESAADIANTKNYGLVKNAGFVRKGVAVAGADDKRTNGTVQFLVAKHEVPVVSYEDISVRTFTDNDTFKGVATTDYNMVRGLIMTPDTARVMIAGGNSSVTTVTTGLNDNATTDSNGKFKIIISSSLGGNFSTADNLSGVRILTASFDPTDKDYFGKVLNRDPDQFYQYQHYLHADFAVDPAAAVVPASGHVAILSGSDNVSISGKAGYKYTDIFGSYDTRYTSPQTTYFISQPFGETEYDLFKFEAIDAGEYANSLYKISITNLKASLDESNPFGTFNVQIRDWNDTDTNPVVLEQFSNCSLDPSSQNYVARLVGDRSVMYNFDSTLLSERRIEAFGKYENRSKYVRIVMSDQVDLGLIPKKSLPFGFRGLPVLNTNPNVKAVSELAPGSSAVRLYGQIDTAAAKSLTGSYIPPVPFRFKATRGEINSTSPEYVGQPGSAENATSLYYWGAMFERVSTQSTFSSTDTMSLSPNVLNEKNGLLESLTKFVGLSKLDALVTGSAADKLHNNKFTLAKVALPNTSIDHITSSVNTHMLGAAYIRNGKVDTADYRVLDPVSATPMNRVSFGTLLSAGTAPGFNRFSSYLKFTNFMYGGFDGVNFLNRDARRMNDKSVSFEAPGGASSNPEVAGFNTNPSGEDKKNNAVASYTAAVDIMTNPMESNVNIVTIPGIREPYVNDVAMKKVKDFGLAMYLMDIPSYDDSNNRMYDDSVTKPNITKTAAALDGRTIDNDYAATYYPDVFIDDPTNRRKVKVPASVAALGALGFNDRVTYPWFAPAGFNRAALDFVNNVAVRLNVADRDRLYESRINPIATFPRLGFVIYGQKTLKATKSALDRVNVRRLLLEIKRIVGDIAQKLVFEQNTPAVRNKFVADSSFQLGLIQSQAGIEAFQVVMNESNNTQEDIDLNRLNGRIVVVPTRVVEFIAIDFIITNSGVEFV
jgi:hypothetical protein